MTATTERNDQTPAGAPPRGERRITEFRPEDAAAVAEMFNGSEAGWPGGFTGGVRMTAERVLDDQRNRRPLTTFLSWDGDACAGFCSFFEYPGERGVAGYVGLLNAATAFHGRGHGRDLLRAALQRAIDLGYRRLDLHTWSGNMRAVPLYKKSGYFWVPDTEVHMENYLPLLLTLPALRDFWREADWYTSFVRDLSVREDLYVEGGMRVYPYEFRRGDRFVKATIDATARGLTALETERWRVGCRVDERRLIAGRAGTVRWEVENRSAEPLTLTLTAEGLHGLRLKREETVTVKDRYVAEAELTVVPDYRPPAPEEPSPKVASLLLLNGLPLRLETGVEVKPAVDIRLSPARQSLVVGQAREVPIEIQSNLAEDATIRLTVAPSPGLTLEGASAAAPTVELPIPAEGYAGAILRVRTDAQGVHALEARATVEGEGEAVALAPVTLPLPAVAPGGMLAHTAERPPWRHPERDEQEEELRVETATHRLVVRLREGRFHLEDAASGDDLAHGTVLAGPPFNWATQALVRHTASVEQEAGAITVRLRGPAPHVASAVAEHELRLSADGLLRVTTALTNASDAPLPLQAGFDIGAHGGGERTVLPTAYGLVRGSGPQWPDWGDLALQRPEMFREGWVAREGDGRVAGALWSEAARIEVGGWNLAELRQGSGDLAPGERRVFPACYVYAGPGDWKTVRALWRRLVAPDAPRQAPPLRSVVALQASGAPDVLLPGEQRLTLSSLTNREVEGELRFDAPEGWAIAPERQPVAGLRIGQDQHVTVEARPAGERPGAAAVKAWLRHERAEERVFDGAALSLGNGEAMHIDEGTLGGRRVLTVDNGFLRFHLAPDFIASIVALETVADGTNHVRSAFPEPREFGWMRPWYGGIYAAVYAPGLGEFGDAARLYRETFTVEEAEEAGQEGRRWRGLAVRSRLTGRGLRGLELRAAYLTLPGSNLLALRLAVRNHSGARLPVHAALLAYLQVGGAVDDAELLLDSEGTRRLRRAQRTVDLPGDGWVGVRNPATGQTVALVTTRGATEAEARGIDWGALGAHAGASLHLDLEPESEQGALAYLALARDEAEAAAYAALRSADGLL